MGNGLRQSLSAGKPEECTLFESGTQCPDKRMFPTRGSFISDASSRIRHDIKTKSSYETGVNPSAAVGYFLLLDLIMLLDHMVVFLWNKTIRKARSVSDSEIALQAVAESKRWAADGLRPTRRRASEAPLDMQHRLACERRKLLCRSTVAPKPTPTDIRVAWRFAHDSYENRLRLGGLLLDLECFVDNSLYGKLSGPHPKIQGRRPGIRGWLRENCPELSSKYFTLMRLKGLAKRLRQTLEIPDPVPTAILFDTTISVDALHAMPINIQPRGRIDQLSRFPWESGKRKTDSRGRVFLTNKGYKLAQGWTVDPTVLSRLLKGARSTLKEILEQAACTAQQNHHRHTRQTEPAIHLVREIERHLTAREIWWRTPLSNLNAHN